MMQSKYRLSWIALDNRLMAYISSLESKVNICIEQTYKL
jgi:hypothetical protein